MAVPIDGPPSLRPPWVARPGLTDLTAFKNDVRAHYDRLAPFRDQWYARNHSYYAYLESRLRLLVPPRQAVLELGCGTGNLLAALQPARALGIDVSPRMIEIAGHKYPRLQFRVDDAETVESREPFDYIIASDLVGDLLDISAVLDRVHALSHGQSRLILTFHNPALEGVLRVAQRAGAAMAPARQNWIGPRDLADLLRLGDFTVEHVESGLLLPLPIPILASVANTQLARLPGPRYFNLVNIVVARPVKPRPRPRPLTCTVAGPPVGRPSSSSRPPSGYWCRHFSACRTSRQTS